jgi:hypothetical protein
VHGVASKVAKKVRVLFEHPDGDAGASEEKSEHHAGRTAAGDDRVGELSAYAPTPGLVASGDTDHPRFRA